MGADSHQVDPAARAIVNSNFDINNVVTMSESVERIVATLNTCSGILKDHCGPQSGYAMLVDNTDVSTYFNPNRFTRDGIRILSAVEFMSPLEKYIKDMITYIGQRVDNKAKDGTTTSMLFSTIFLTQMFANRDRILSLGNSIFDATSAMKEVEASIKENLKKYTWTIDRLFGKETTEAEAIHTAGQIAFCQALSSSGGDLMLAKAMKEIFEKSPKVSWDFIGYKHHQKEQGEAFQVEVDPYDARIRAIVNTDNSLNYALNTEYLEKDVDVLIYPGSLDDMSLDTDEIMAYLRAVPTDQPVSVVAVYFSPKMQTEINQLNRQRKKPIVLWGYSPEQQLAGQSYPWELLILSAVAGVTPANMGERTEAFDSHFLFRAKELYYHDAYIDFYGIVDMPEGECLHPFYKDPETATPYYNDIKLALEKQIELYRSGHKPDGRMMGLFIEMLNTLACVRRPTLRLGGTTHEQVANADVVNDVQGAIMASLNNGFLINGPLAISAAIKDAFEHLMNHTAEEDVKWQLKKVILTSMLAAINEVITTVYAEFSDREITDISRKTARDPELYTNSFTGMVYTIGGFKEKLEQEIYEDLSHCYPVCQPVDITYELIRRVGELLLKFIHTNKIVVGGGVVIKQEGEEDV